MKYLIIIGDGMADEHMPQLGGKTPLEHVSIPTINRLARKGIVGSTQNCPEGFPCGSDTAIMSIMGCDPKRYYTGRGAMEAAAVGAKLLPGDAVFRFNLITVEPGDGILDGKAFVSSNAKAIEGEDALAVVSTLLQDPEFSALLEKYHMDVYPTPSFRQILVEHGGDYEGLYFNDEDWEGIPGPCSISFPKGNSKADKYIELMRLANKILEHASINKKRASEGKCPANGIWIWCESKASAMPSIREEFGVEGSVIAAVPLAQGIGMLRGLERIYVEGANGEIDTNIEGKVDAAWNEIQQKDFVFIHFEAPDECSHAGSLTDKLQAIEWLDSRLVAPLSDRMEKAGYDYRLLLLSDHRTFVRTKNHERTPVPFLLYDSRTDTGKDVEFTEDNGLAGPFVEEGHKLIKLLFEKENL